MASCRRSPASEASRSLRPRRAVVCVRAQIRWTIDRDHSTAMVTETVMSTSSLL